MLLKEPLQSFNLTDDEVMRLALSTLTTTAHEMTASIKNMIRTREEEVHKQYLALPDADKQRFRWKFIAQVLHRGYLLALERADKADDRVPETLME